MNHTEFKSCAFGIHNRMVSANTMLYNIFELGELPGAIASGDQFGIFLEGGIMGMDIEGNEFRCDQVVFGACPSSQVVTTGILASSLGGKNQPIRGNLFDGIQNGIVANGLNTSVGDLGGASGLYFVCNRNSNISGYDFSIAATESNDLIRKLQRDGSFSAGNTFSADNQISGNHFFNEEGDSSKLIYYFFETGLNEYPEDIFEITRVNDPLENDCGTQFPNPGPVIDVHGPDRINLEETKVQFHAQKDTLESFVTSYYGAVAANDTGLSDYYWNLVSARGSIVDALNQDILQLVSTDTVTYDFQEYLYWIERIDSYEADLWRVRELGNAGDWQKANDILDSINFLRSLSVEQETDLSRIIIISNILEQHTLNLLAPAHIDTLRDIGDLGLGTASIWANTILTTYGEYRPPVYKLCEGNSNRIPILSTGVKVLDQDDFVSVYPNPARDFVSFEINNKKSANASLDIWDISGMKILTVESFQHQYTWSTGNIPEGIYIYSILTDDGNVLSGKIVKQ